MHKLAPHYATEVAILAFAVNNLDNVGSKKKKLKPTERTIWWVVAHFSHIAYHVSIYIYICKLQAAGCTHGSYMIPTTWKGGFLI